MLLVGHTHDIVDQMFSVWARMLRIHNAETYEKMRELFRERYHSKIEGLVQLMNGQAEAYEAMSDTARNAYDFEKVEAPVDWSKEQADILADFSAFVATHKLQPYIVQQTVTMDVEGWLRQAVAKGTEPPILKGIPKAYNFGVEKDAKGNVFLFNSQFAKSATRVGGKAIHNYPHQPTGSYTTRAHLYTAADPGLRIDPYRVPPLTIDLAPLRATVIKFVEHKAMSLEEQRQFDAMLDRLDDGQSKQKADCMDCYNALTSFGKHGVVSQRKKASEAEKDEATKKLSARNKSWDDLQAHLRDPAFAAVHDATMVHTGFWTKWLKRQREHIQPAFIDRGYMTNPVDLAEPYHPPATELCSGVGEPPVHSDQAERIDLMYLRNQGTPLAGQVAILRTSLIREPFYVCKIKAVRLSERAMRKLHPEREAQAPAELAAGQSLQPPAEAQPNETAPAAAACAAAATARPISELVPAPRLKDLEFQLTYYDLCNEDFQKFHLSVEKETPAKQAVNDNWWKEQFAKNMSEHEQLQTEAELTAAIKTATNKHKPPPKRPCWLVDLYEDARFLYDVNEPALERRGIPWESGATMVAWGSVNALLKAAGKSGHGHSTWRLKAPVFRQVREDLTESKQAAPAALNGNEHHQSGAVGNQASASGARGKKKARAQPVAQLHDDDSSDHEVAPKPTPAAAATRPRLPRSTHAKKAIVEDSNDEEEEQEEEQEEEEEEEEEPAAKDVEMASDASDESDSEMVRKKRKQRNQNQIKSKQKGAQEFTAEVTPPKKQKKTPAPAAAAAAATVTGKRRTSTGRNNKS